MMALIPIRSSFCESGPPAFASLIPFVSGLFPPTDVRPQDGAFVPARSPVATINLFSGPSGSHLGGTSLLSILAINPLPPMRRNSSGSSSIFASNAPILIRSILSIFIIEAAMSPRILSLFASNLANSFLLRSFKEILSNESPLVNPSTSKYLLTSKRSQRATLSPLFILSLLVAAGEARQLTSSPRLLRLCLAMTKKVVPRNDSESPLTLLQCVRSEAR